MYYSYILNIEVCNIVLIYAILLLVTTHGYVNIVAKVLNMNAVQIRFVDKDYREHDRV